MITITLGKNSVPGGVENLDEYLEKFRADFKAEPGLLWRYRCRSSGEGNSSALSTCPRGSTQNSNGIRQACGTTEPLSLRVSRKS